MSTSAPAARPPLWPQPIPIIGGTGEKSAGKTKFGLNICPGDRTTLVFDLEQSSAGYEGEYARIGVPFERVDVQAEMYKTHPKGYKAIDLFNWWLAYVRGVPAGKYRVIAVDPVTDLESGLADWVEANPTFFGHTAGQYASMSGIKWGDVKSLQKMVLADLCARCDTFYFTAHLGSEWGADKKPTGKKKVKGKETLHELASLYLWFDRSPNAQTGVRPNVPSATVLKGRQERAELIDGEVVSYCVLPARLPAATPRAIRDYFKNPAGRRDATDGERLREEVMSADDKLKLEVAKAEAEAATAQAHAAAAAAQKVTVAVPIGPRAAEFEQTIRGATSTEFLKAEVAPGIKVASDAGQLSAAEVDYLRAVFNDTGRRLKAAETQA